VPSGDPDIPASVGKAHSKPGVWNTGLSSASYRESPEGKEWLACHQGRTQEWDKGPRTFTISVHRICTLHTEFAILFLFVHKSLLICTGAYPEQRGQCLINMESKVCLYISSNSFMEDKQVGKVTSKRMCRKQGVEMWERIKIAR